jgi:hypothetical protein
MNPLASVTPLSLRPLPDGAVRILLGVGASPRLLAHLRLVHDVAVQLCDHLHQEGLLATVDRSALLFGAATHDIGKTRFPTELSEPGSEHERHGQILLLEQGVLAPYARFAETHGSWRITPDLPLEDLLVALADTCWKGKRDATLEQRIADHLTLHTQRDPWAVWLTLDTVIEEITNDADRRLRWQAQFPIAS